VIFIDFLSPEAHPANIIFHMILLIQQWCNVKMMMVVEEIMVMIMMLAKSLIK